MSGLDVKIVPITASTFVESGMQAPNLGPVVLMLPEGPALCHDARSCTIITGERPGTGERFLVVVSVAEVNGEVVGTLAQMTPAEARRFAASLNAGAGECEERAD